MNQFLKKCWSSLAAVLLIAALIGCEGNSNQTKGDSRPQKNDFTTENYRIIDHLEARDLLLTQITSSLKDILFHGPKIQLTNLTLPRKYQTAPCLNSLNDLLIHASDHELSVKIDFDFFNCLDRSRVKFGGLEKLKFEGSFKMSCLDDNLFKYDKLTIGSFEQNETTDICPHSQKIEIFREWETTYTRRSTSEQHLDDESYISTIEHSALMNPNGSACIFDQNDAGATLASCHFFYKKSHPTYEINGEDAPQSLAGDDYIEAEFINVESSRTEDFFQSGILRYALDNWYGRFDFVKESEKLKAFAAPNYPNYVLKSESEEIHDEVPESL